MGYFDHKAMILKLLAALREGSIAPYSLRDWLPESVDATRARIRGI